ncbi:hypothetical protein [Kocuria sp. U4B]
MHPPTVLALGSCRVIRPLRTLHASGRIQLLNHDKHLQWFTHTAAAARQSAEILTGLTTIPPAYREVVFETHLELPENLAHPGPMNLDLVIVEVGTWKQQRLKGLELNGHKVYGIAERDGYAGRHVMHGRTGDLPEDHLLKHVTYSRAEHDEIARDLLRIREILKTPVMAVNPTYSEGSDGTQIPERAKLTEQLRAIEAEHGIPFYDTKDVILTHGIDVALKDPNHYRTDFEPVVGEHMHQMIQQVTTNRTGEPAFGLV